jgi:hypothetical protein
MFKTVSLMVLLALTKGAVLKEGPNQKFLAQCADGTVTGGAGAGNLLG